MQICDYAKMFQSIMNPLHCTLTHTEYSLTPFHNTLPWYSSVESKMASDGEAEAGCGGEGEGEGGGEGEGEEVDMLFGSLW